MFKNENYRVKQIDRIILEELRKRLEMQVENIEIIKGSETEKILGIIEEKKKGILLLFQGDFTLNERNIKEKIPQENRELSFYEKIANNIILKRISKIFNKIMKLQAKDYRLISVCVDRQLFIQKILSENIQTSFIESCINQRER